MKKIISLTDAQKAQLKPWADKWIANALSTRPIEEHEKPVIRKHVKGLYESAGLKPPPDNRIIFVPSPVVARFAGGFAAWLWYLKENNKKFEYPHSVTTNAITNEVTEATSEATYEAIDAAIDMATYAATATEIDKVTDDATAAATYKATNAATYKATYKTISEAIDDATKEAISEATYKVTYKTISDTTTDEAINAAIDKAIDAATDATIEEAIDTATFTATYKATDEAIDDATKEAISEAIDDATSAATEEAIDEATYKVIRNEIKDRPINDKFYRINGDIAAVAAHFGDVKILMSCAYKAYKMYHGGNFWSGWCAMISFFRYVVELDIDYTKWNDYEKLTELSSYRIMHKEFCIISDRPKTLLIDNQNRPHCDGGPYCEWRDGSMIFALNGVYVPEYLAVTPAEKLDIEFFKRERNADVRAEFIRKFGIERMISLGKSIQKWTDYTDDWFNQSEYELIDMGQVYGIDYAPHLKMKNLTTGIYHLEGVHPDCKTIEQALNWRAKGQQIKIGGIK